MESRIEEEPSDGISSVQYDSQYDNADASKYSNSDFFRTSILREGDTEEVISGVLDKFRTGLLNQQNIRQEELRKQDPNYVEWVPVCICKMCPRGYTGVCKVSESEMIERALDGEHCEYKSEFPVEFAVDEVVQSDAVEVVSENSSSGFILEPIVSEATSSKYTDTLLHKLVVDSAVLGVSYSFAQNALPRGIKVMGKAKFASESNGSTSLLLEKHTSLCFAYSTVAVKHFENALESSYHDVLPVVPQSNPSSHYNHKPTMVYQQNASYTVAMTQFVSSLPEQPVSLFHCGMAAVLLPESQKKGKASKGLHASDLYILPNGQLGLFEDYGDTTVALKAGQWNTVVLAYTSIPSPQLTVFVNGMRGAEIGDKQQLGNRMNQSNGVFTLFASPQANLTACSNHFKLGFVRFLPALYDTPEDLARVLLNTPYSRWDAAKQNRDLQVRQQLALSALYPKPPPIWAHPMFLQLASSDSGATEAQVGMHALLAFILNGAANDQPHLTELVKTVSGYHAQSLLRSAAQALLWLATPTGKPAAPQQIIATLQSLPEGSCAFVPVPTMLHNEDDPREPLAGHIVLIVERKDTDLFHFALANTLLQGGVRHHPLVCDPGSSESPHFLAPNMRFCPVVPLCDVNYLRATSYVFWMSVAQGMQKRTDSGFLSSFDLYHRLLPLLWDGEWSDVDMVYAHHHQDNSLQKLPMMLSQPIVFDMHPLETEGSYLETLLHCISYLCRRKGCSSLISSVITHSLQVQCLRLCFQDSIVMPYLGASDHAVVNLMIQKVARFTADLVTVIPDSVSFSAITHDAINRLASVLEKDAAPLSDYEYQHSKPMSNVLGRNMTDPGFTDDHKRHPQLDHLLQYQDISELVGDAYGNTSTIFVDISSLPKVVYSPSDILYCLLMTVNVSTKLLVSSKSVQNAHYLVFNTIYQVQTQVIPVPSVRGSANRWEGPWHGSFTYAQQVQCVAHLHKLSVLLLNCFYALPSQSDADASDVRLEQCTDWVPHEHSFHKTVPQTHVVVCLMVTAVMTDYILHKPTMDVVNPLTTVMNAGSWGIGMGTLASLTETMIMFEPELCVARTRCLDYISDAAYTHPIFLWKTNKAEHNVLTLYSSFAHTMKYPISNDELQDDIFASTPSRPVTYYFTAYHPEMQHYRDMLTMLRVVALLEIQAHTGVPPINRCVPTYTVSGTSIMVRVGEKSITFAPRSLTVFPSYSNAQVVANEEHRTNHFQSDNKDTYTPITVECEEDVLHLPNLPQFNGQVSQSDSERYLSILTAPYLRIPLILEFISQPGKIHTLLSHDFAKSVFSAMFEPSIYETRTQNEQAVAELQSLRQKNLDEEKQFMQVPYKPAMLSTRYGQLFNECFYNCRVITSLCHLLMLEAMQLDSGSPYNTTVSIVLFCTRLCVGVLKYLVWFRNYHNNGNAMYPYGVLHFATESGQFSDVQMLEECIAQLETDLRRVSASVLVPWLDITRNSVNKCLLKQNNPVVDHSKEHEEYEATIALLRNQRSKALSETSNTETLVAPLVLLLGLENNDTKVVLDPSDVSVAVELACAIHVHNTIIHSAFLNIAVSPSNIHAPIKNNGISAVGVGFGGLQQNNGVVQSSTVTYASNHPTKKQYMLALSALTRVPITTDNINSMQHLLSAAGYLQSRSSWQNVLPVPDMAFLQSIQQHTQTIQQLLQSLHSAEQHGQVFDSLVGVVMGTLSHGAQNNGKLAEWVMAPDGSYTKWCRVVPSLNPDEIATDVEVDTQLFQVTVRSSHLQALPSDLAADPNVQFHLGTGSSQAAVIETTSQRTWYRVIGRDLDVFHWMPEPRRAEVVYTRQYSPEDLYPSEEWLVPLFEPVRMAFFNDKMDPTPVFIQTRAIEGDVAHLVVMRQSSGAAWKEVFVYRHTCHVEVFTIMSYGRRWYRTLSYTTNHNFSLFQPEINQEQETPWESWGRWEAGQARDNISNTGDAVIERESLPHPDIARNDNISGLKERFVPAILLQGSLPQALLDRYTFWQCDNDVIRGYPVNKQTSTFIHISQLSAVTHHTHQRRIACGHVRRVAQSKWKEFSAGDLSHAEDQLDLQSLSPSNPLYNSVCSLAYAFGLSQVLCWVASEVMSNNEFTSTLQFADTVIDSDHSLRSVRSIEVQQLNISFTLKQDPVGEVQLYSQDHPNLYLSPLHAAVKHRIHRPHTEHNVDKHALVMLTKLSVSLPLSLLLQSAEGAFHILVPALEPVRPQIKGRPLTTELVYPQTKWLHEFNSPYLLYPVHSSLEFILPSTSSSSLYLLVHKYLGRDYVSCCQVIDSCVGEEKYSAIEEVMVDTIVRSKVSEDANAYAFLLQFLFALRHSKLRTWQPFSVVARYCGLGWAKYTAAECRVSRNVEVAMMEILLEHIPTTSTVSNDEKDKGFRQVVFPALIRNRHASLTSGVSACVLPPKITDIPAVHTPLDVKQLQLWLTWMEEGAINGTVPSEYAHLEEEEEDGMQEDYVIPHNQSTMKKFYYPQNLMELNKVILADLIIQAMEVPLKLSMLYGLLTGEVTCVAPVEFDLAHTFVTVVRDNKKLVADPLYWVIRAVLQRPNLARHQPKIADMTKVVFGEDQDGSSYGCKFPGNCSFDWTDLVVAAVELVVNVDTYIPNLLSFTPHAFTRSSEPYKHTYTENRMDITLRVADADQQLIAVHPLQRFEEKQELFPYILGKLHTDSYLYEQPLGVLGSYVASVSHGDMQRYRGTLGDVAVSSEMDFKSVDTALDTLLDEDLSRYPVTHTHTAQAMMQQLSADVYEYGQQQSTNKYNALTFMHPKDLSDALQKDDSKYISRVQESTDVFMQELLTLCTETKTALAAARGILTQLLTSHPVRISGNSESMFVASVDVSNIDHGHVCVHSESYHLSGSEVVASSASVEHTHLGTSSILRYLLDVQARRENKVPILFTVSLLLSKQCEPTLCSLLPFICPCRARLIKDAAVNLVFHSTKLDALYRVLADIHSFHAMLGYSSSVSDKEAVYAMLTQKAETIADAVMIKRPYIIRQDESIYLDPRIFVFEFSISLLIRSSQHAMQQSFLGALSNNQSKVQQLIMGAGKTTVIAPLLALALSDGKCMVVQVVPPALLQFSTTVLRSAFSSIIRKPVCVFSYDRSTVLSKQQMYRLEECMQNRGVILATPTSVKSVLLRYLEICSEIHNASVITPSVETKEQMEALRTLLLYFREGYLLVDEVDLVLHPLKSELNFPLGNKEPLDLSPYRWQLATHLLDGFFSASRHAKEGTELIVPASFKDVHNSKQILQSISEQLVIAAKHVYIQFQPHVALLNTDWYHTELKPLLVEWLLLWLGQAHITIPDWCVRQYLVESEQMLCMSIEAECEFSDNVKTLADKKIQLLNLSRAWLHSYLPHCLSRICNVHYGLLLPSQAKLLLSIDPNMPLSRLYLAIPFVGKDTPSQASEFAHPDMTIGFTYLAYRHQGLRFGDISSLVNDLQSHYEGEVGVPENRPSCVRYRGWVESHGGFVRAESIHQKGMEVQSLKLIKKSNHKHMNRLYDLLRNSAAVALYYVCEIVFPTFLRFQAHKISACGVDQGGSMLFKRRVGFSGTPSSLLPLSMGVCQHQKTADAQVLSLLTNTSVTSCLQLDRQWDAEKLLQVIARAADAKGKAMYHSLIDAGALITGMSNETVARKQLQYGLTGLDGVVFLGEDDKKLVLVRSTGRVSDLEQCGVPVERRFAFYDQVHTTGMDIKHTVNARAAITLNKDMVWRDFAQGAFRMRGIGKGQRVCVFVPPEVLADMRRTTGKDACPVNANTVYYQEFHNSALLKAICAWLLLNSMETEALQYVQLSRQNASDVWRYMLVNLALFTGDSKDIVRRSCEEYLCSINSSITNGLPDVHPLLAPILGTVATNVPTVTQSLQLLLENVDTSVPSYLPSSDIHSSSLAALVKDHLQVLPVVLQTLASRIVHITVKSTNTSIHLQTEMVQTAEDEKEKEQEQEQEREVEQEKFVDLGFSRDNETPLSWNLYELCRFIDGVQVHPFYPAKEWKLCETNLTLPFSENVYLSRNYYNPDWSGIRRLRNTLTYAYVDKPMLCYEATAPCNCPPVLLLNNLNISTEQSVFGCIHHCGDTSFLNCEHTKNTWMRLVRQLPNYVDTALLARIALVLYGCDEVSTKQLESILTSEGIASASSGKAWRSGEMFVHKLYLLRVLTHPSISRRSDASAAKGIALSLSEAQSIRKASFIGYNVWEHSVQIRSLMGNCFAVTFPSVEVNRLKDSVLPAANRYSFQQERQHVESALRFIDADLYPNHSDISNVVSMLGNVSSNNRLVWCELVQSCKRKIKTEWRSTTFRSHILVPSISELVTTGYLSHMLSRHFETPIKLILSGDENNNLVLDLDETYVCVMTAVSKHNVFNIDLTDICYLVMLAGNNVAFNSKDTSMRTDGGLLPRQQPALLNFPLEPELITKQDVEPVALLTNLNLDSKQLYNKWAHISDAFQPTATNDGQKHAAISQSVRSILDKFKKRDDEDTEQDDVKIEEMTNPQRDGNVIGYNFASFSLPASEYLQIVGEANLVQDVVDENMSYLHLSKHSGMIINPPFTSSGAWTVSMEVRFPKESFNNTQRYAKYNILEDDAHVQQIPMLVLCDALMSYLEGISTLIVESSPSGVVDNEGVMDQQISCASYCKQPLKTFREIFTLPMSVLHTADPHLCGCVQEWRREVHTLAKKTAAQNIAKGQVDKTVGRALISNYIPAERNAPMGIYNESQLALHSKATMLHCGRVIHASEKTLIPSDCWIIMTVTYDGGFLHVYVNDEVLISSAGIDDSLKLDEHILLFGHASPALTNTSVDIRGLMIVFGAMTNDAVQGFCGGAAEQPYKWTCPKCGCIYNEINQTKCYRCGAKNPQHE